MPAVLSTHLREYFGAILRLARIHLQLSVFSFVESLWLSCSVAPGPQAWSLAVRVKLYGEVFFWGFFFFFFCIFFFFGPLVPWLRSPGPPVLWSWSPGPPVLWSPGPPVPWSPNPPVLWSPGSPVLLSSGPLVLWSSSSTSVLDNHNNNNNQVNTCNAFLAMSALGGRRCALPPNPPPAFFNFKVGPIARTNTPTQKHHHTNTKTPQKHHKNTTKSPPHHNKSTTTRTPATKTRPQGTPQKHHHTTTKTPQQEQHH